MKTAEFIVMVCLIASIAILAGTGAYQDSQVMKLRLQLEHCESIDKASAPSLQSDTARFERALL